MIIINLAFKAMSKTLVFFLFLISSSLYGQELTKIDYTWAHGFNLKKDISYGEEEAQKLDIYIQGDPVGPPKGFKEDTVLKPTLIYFHGGGWRVMTKEDFVNQQFYIYFMEKGWNVVNVEYRLGEGTAPDAADDVLCAVKWVAENAEKYHIDKDKIVLTGPSAGGHLCLIAGLMNSVPESHSCYVGDKINIRAIINWFGVSDIGSLNEFLINRKRNMVQLWVGDSSKVEDIAQKYSPINYVTKDAPPIISIHGDADPVIPHSQAELLHKELEEVNVKNQLVTLQGGSHLGFTKEQFQFSNEQIFLFLDSIMD
jgi:acetyl esterase/lipase